MKSPAYLFGPFVGELSWEFFRFAPFAIKMKKEHPNILMIVFTRQSRFDLYGKYADILIPLRIPNDINLERQCFRLERLMTRDYNIIGKKFRSKYKKRFEIIKHFYPDIQGWRYKLKWQFSRRKMAYDFLPRDKNKMIAKKFIKKHNYFVDNSYVEYYDDPDAIKSIDFFSKVSNQVDNYDTTTIGCIIEGLKMCKFVIGNLESPTSHLAILLGKPFICINNKLSFDSIKLLNPLKVKIIFSDDVNKGAEKYENSF